VPTSTLGFRDGDTFGVGYAVVDFQDSLSTSQADRFEQVGEAYYNFKVNDRLSLIPSLQIGSKIAGTNTNDLSYGAGFRASVKF
jgi:carbohydrate-selective porin OprB